MEFHTKIFCREIVLGRQFKKKLKEVLMKTLKCVLVLFSFWGLMLVGCSDESQSPVFPTDQSSASLQKNIIRPFTGHEHPTSVVSPGTVHIANGKQISKGVLFTTRFEATFTDGKPNLLSGNGFLEL